MSVFGALRNGANLALGRACPGLQQDLLLLILRPFFLQFFEQIESAIVRPLDGGDVANQAGYFLGLLDEECSEGGIRIGGISDELLKDRRFVPAGTGEAP